MLKPTWGDFGVEGLDTQAHGMCEYMFINPNSHLQNLPIMYMHTFYPYICVFVCIYSNGKEKDRRYNA